MRSSAALIASIFCVLSHGAVGSGQGSEFQPGVALGTVGRMAGNLISALNQRQAAQTGLLPSHEAQKAMDTQEKALETQQDIPEIEGETKSVVDTYKQLALDVDSPLEEQTEGLENKKVLLTAKARSLTDRIRAIYDGLYPDRVNSPLIIVAKNHEDDEQLEADKVEQEGALDFLKGVASPSAAFHKQKLEEAKQLQKPDDENMFSVQSDTLNEMTPKQRQNYDAKMIAEADKKIRETETSIKIAKADAKAMSGKAGGGNVLKRLVGALTK